MLWFGGDVAVVVWWRYRYFDLVVVVVERFWLYGSIAVVAW